MKKILMLSLVLLLMTGSSAFAGKSTFGGSWNITAGMGDTSDFASGVHFRGASLEWRSFYKTDSAFGLNVSWDVLNEEFDGTYQGENFAVTGKSWRYLNAVPIYLSWHKYTGDDRRGKRTFFGMNAGTSYIHRRTEMGVFQVTNENWHLAVAPEIGMQMPWDAFLGWASVRYNYAFSAGDVDAQQWFEFRLGFGLN